MSSRRCSRIKTIEFTNVNDEPFDESQLVVVTPFRGHVSLGDAHVHSLPKAGFVRTDRFFDRDRKDLPPLDFHGKIGVVADTLIDKNTAALVQKFKSKGATKVILASVFTSPEELEKIYAAHPDVEIFTATVDETLNENRYIVPGLGDAGDRIFGTL